mmetsp:Transcript_90614/g.207333  ORF Transcript_90614/g.207333 Transcript_90614/m.207333 type:complete len:200 (-) Transcript_90614:90-689(-)
MSDNTASHLAWQQRVNNETHARTRFLAAYYRDRFANRIFLSAAEPEDAVDTSYEAVHGFYRARSDPSLRRRLGNRYCEWGAPEKNPLRSLKSQSRDAAGELLGDDVIAELKTKQLTGWYHPGRPSSRRPSTHHSTRVATRDFLVLEQDSRRPQSRDSLGKRSQGQISGVELFSGGLQPPSTGFSGLRVSSSPGRSRAPG